MKRWFSVGTCILERGRRRLPRSAEGDETRCARQLNDALARHRDLGWSLFAATEGTALITPKRGYREIIRAVECGGIRFQFRGLARRRAPKFF
jgi:hypothetical protein